MTQQATQQFRKETPNGVFTILEFKAKECMGYNCHEALPRKHCSCRKTKLCRKCASRETANIAGVLSRLRGVRQFAEDIPFHVLKAHTIQLDKDGGD